MDEKTQNRIMFAVMMVTFLVVLSACLAVPHLYSPLPSECEEVDYKRGWSIGFDMGYNKGFEVCVNMSEDQQPPTNCPEPYSPPQSAKDNNTPESYKDNYMEFWPQNQT